MRFAGKKSKLFEMSVSLCLIARNEEKNIERVLRSIKPVADEIILTDTGSTDATIQIAQKFGAKISHFPWCDDLSAARNFGYKQATGENQSAHKLLDLQLGYPDGTGWRVQINGKGL